VGPAHGPSQKQHAANLGPAGSGSEPVQWPPGHPAGAPSRKGQIRPGHGARTKQIRDAERALATQAAQAYRRTIADWKAVAPPKAGASVTPGRASQRPSKGKAARQTTSP